VGLALACMPIYACLAGQHPHGIADELSIRATRILHFGSLLMLQASAKWHSRAHAGIGGASEIRVSEILKFSCLIGIISRESAREYAIHNAGAREERGSRLPKQSRRYFAARLEEGGCRSRDSAGGCQRGYFVPRFTASVLLPELARVLDTTGDTNGRCLALSREPAISVPDEQQTSRHPRRRVGQRQTLI
jgi:hypothetical protein